MSDKSKVIDHFEVDICGYKIKQRAAPTLDALRKVGDVLNYASFTVDVDGEEVLVIYGVEKKERKLFVDTYVSSNDTIPLRKAKAIVVTSFDTTGKPVFDLHYKVSNPVLEAIKLNSQDSKALTMHFSLDIVETLIGVYSDMPEVDNG